MSNETSGIAPKGKASDKVKERYQTLHELTTAAQEKLNENIWHYLVGGSETETSMLRNRLALDSLGFRPRILKNVSQIDLSTNFFGAELNLPLMFAPIGSLESFHPDGGAAAARASARAGIITCLSSVSAPGLETTAQAAAGPKIYQLYVRGDSNWIDSHVERAIDFGYLAFCLTVDTALYSRRERDITRRFVKPWRTRAKGLEYQAALNWKDITRFKSIHNMPLILKGIMTPEDAILAVNEGVNGIWVSNHGGRQLDHTIGTISVLQEIVDAVAGRASIIIDGGFLRGTDIIKGLALGADMVALGRLTAMALGAAGEEGLVRAIDLLAEEIWIAMGLLGITNLRDLSSSIVQPAPTTCLPSAFSAFPHFTNPI